MSFAPVDGCFVSVRHAIAWCIQNTPDLQQIFNADPDDTFKNRVYIGRQKINSPQKCHLLITDSGYRQRAKNSTYRRGRRVVTVKACLDCEGWAEKVGCRLHTVLRDHFRSTNFRTLAGSIGGYQAGDDSTEGPNSFDMWCWKGQFTFCERRAGRCESLCPIPAKEAENVPTDLVY